MSKILIAGGSYGMYSHKGTWIDRLKQSVNLNISNVCQPGCSNYIMLKNIKEEVSKNNYDIIIILPVPYTRIPIVNNYPDLCSWLPDDPQFPDFWKIFWKHFNPLQDSEEPFLDYQKAARYYFKYYHNEEFLVWVNKSILRDLEELLSHKKIIWIDTGLSELFNYINFGIKVKGTLNTISKLEWDIVTDSEYNNKDKIDYRHNHLCKDNQIVLANFLTNIINKSEKDLTEDDINLNKLNWIKDPKILSSMFDKIEEI